MKIGEILKQPASHPTTDAAAAAASDAKQTGVTPKPQFLLSLLSQFLCL